MPTIDEMLSGSIAGASQEDYERLRLAGGMGGRRSPLREALADPARFRAYTPPPLSPSGSMPRVGDVQYDQRGFPLGMTTPDYIPGRRASIPYNPPAAAWNLRDEEAARAGVIPMPMSERGRRLNPYDSASPDWGSGDILPASAQRQADQAVAQYKAEKAARMRDPSDPIQLSRDLGGYGYTREPSRQEIIEAQKMIGDITQRKSEERVRAEMAASQTAEAKARGETSALEREKFEYAIGQGARQKIYEDVTLKPLEREKRLAEIEEFLAKRGRTGAAASPGAPGGAGPSPQQASPIGIGADVSFGTAAPSGVGGGPAQSGALNRRILLSAIMEGNPWRALEGMTEKFGTTGLESNWPEVMAALEGVYPDVEKTLRGYVPAGGTVGERLALGRKLPSVRLYDLLRNRFSTPREWIGPAIPGGGTPVGGRIGTGMYK